MFYGCRRLNEVPLFNTSNVTNMFAMFSGCIKLITIPLLDTSNVTNMHRMFSECYNLKTIPLLDTQNVFSFDYMFTYCTKLENIPTFEISKSIEKEQKIQLENVFFECNKIDIFNKLIFYYQNDDFLIKLLESSSISNEKLNKLLEKYEQK
jgi:surface protein